MNVAAVIVTYNRKDMLVKCLQCIFEQKKYQVDIILVDNASTDGTSDLISGMNNDRIKYFNTGANLGGAGGFSFGVKKGYELGYDFCWLMDDDTMPHPDSIASMLDKIQIIDASYICSRVIWIDGSACSMNTPPTAKRGCFYNELALDMHLMEIRGCSFVSCLINMRYVKEAGLPIAEFFIYGDDVEYSRRLEKFAKGYLDLDSIVTHAMQNNNVANLVNCEEERIERYKYGVRNNVYIQRTIDNMSTMKILMDMLRTVAIIILKSKNNKFKRIFVVLTSTIKGLHFNPNIERV